MICFLYKQKLYKKKKKYIYLNILNIYKYLEIYRYKLIMMIHILIHKI